LNLKLEEVITIIKVNIISFKRKKLNCMMMVPPPLRKVGHVVGIFVIIISVFLSGCSKSVEELEDARDVEGLIAALSSSDAGKRAEAAEALGNIADTRAIDPLIVTLHDEDPDVRQKSAEALAKMGNDATLPLIEVLDDDDWKVRSKVAWALGKLGDRRAVPKLKITMKDEVKDVRQMAVWAVGEIGVETSVIPLLFEALYDESPDVREEARMAILKIGELAASDLVAALNHPDPYIRNFSANSLGIIGGKRGASFEVKKMMAEPLVNALKDENEDVRLSVAIALDKLKFIPRNDQEAAWYHNAKRDWDEMVFLGKLAIEPLILSLKAEDDSVKWGATRALVRIGPDAVDPLIKALDNEDTQIQAAIALEIIGTEKAKKAVDGFVSKYGADLEYIATNYDQILEEVDVEGYEFLLILALERHGDIHMLNALLQSGDEVVIDAATFWAERKGYFVQEEATSWP